MLYFKVTRFPNSGHVYNVLQGINLAFIFFLNHAYSLVLLCTCMHTYRTTFDISSSLGYHLLV